MAYIFVPKELQADENRVAATPATVKRFIQDKLRVGVEKGAGEKSFFSDEHYEGAGAEIVSDAETGFRSADIILMVNPPTSEQIELMPAGSSLISFLCPFQDVPVIEHLAKRKVNAFSVNSIPRITRTQDQDALSSLSNLAGYKAVLLAAVACPKIFPLLMTAAGTLRPARVVVIGAGVAGLQAVATAKRLGAIVEVSDVRMSVKEQIESLGARFIDLPVRENLEAASGYAKEASEEFLRKQHEILCKHLIEADVVITTALVPGRPAPKLISAKIVEQMPKGSVIVDLAAQQGGNCELTVKGKTVEKFGTTIIGTLNLAGSVPVSASTVYARNLQSIVLSQLDKNKKFAWMMDKQEVSDALLTYDGAIRKRETQ